MILVTLLSHYANGEQEDIIALSTDRDKARYLIEDYIKKENDIEKRMFPDCDGWSGELKNSVELYANEWQYEYDYGTFFMYELEENRLYERKKR